MDRRAVVSGGSVAGLTAAYWLARTGWTVTVVERASSFRDGGQNVDVRGEARAVADRMGLTAAIREATTTEEGTRFVDEEGATVAEFPAREGEDGPTAELEVLRGDLARIVLEALPAGVEVRYGDTIAAVDDDPGAGPVQVRFASGAVAECDLLVVAEGVRSSTRALVLPADEEREALRPLDVTIVYGTIPRGDADDRWWSWCTATGGCQVMLRPDNRGTTRAMLAYASDRHDRDDLRGADPEQRDDVLRELFADAGWQAERILEGLATSEDVYVDALAQVVLPRWSVGRVVLVGDAAWCVTPLGGGGSSLALLGGYTLAAALSRHADVGEALVEYDAWMRPVVDRTQGLPPGFPRLAYPETRLGVGAQRLAARIAGSGPVRGVAGRLAGSVATSERDLLEIA